MTYQPISVAPPPGIARQASSRASRGRWWDGNLVRWREGVLQPVGGWRSLEGLVLPEPARAMLEWKSLDGLPLVAIGTRSGLYIWDGTLTDITPAGFVPLDPPSLLDGFGIGDFGEETYGTPRTIEEPELARVEPGDWWSLDNWGEKLFALSTSTGLLYQWDPATPAAPATVVAEAPTGGRAMAVTQERQVVIAGLNDDWRRVAWSDTEDYTVWEATPDNLAGGLNIKSTGMPLTMKRVREGLLVLTDADAHLLRYLGPPFGMGIDRIGSGCGLAGPMAVTSATEFVLWFGPKTLWVYAGGVRPLQCPLAYDLAHDINARMKVLAFAGVMDAEQEVWLFWPGEGSTECDRYLIWSWRDDVWSWGRLTRTAYTQGAADLAPLLAGLDSKIYEHEVGWLADGESRAGTVWAETADLVLNDTAKQLVVRGIIPDIDGAADALQFRFTMREKPHGPERSIGPLRCAPGADWIEKRFGAVNIRLRVEGVSDAFWGLGELRLDAVMGSGR